MHPRRQIPAIALLGLQLTECAAEQDPIIGEWYAVEVDGQAFPWEESMAGEVFRSGYEMLVEPDLRGSLTLYHAESYDDFTVRSEYSSPLTVDPEAASRYRLEIVRPARGSVGSEPGDGGYGDGYGADDRPAPAGLTATARPATAETTVVRFDCALAVDLDCTWTAGDDAPLQIRFARRPEDER